MHISLIIAVLAILALLLLLVLDAVPSPNVGDKGLRARWARLAEWARK